MPSANPRVVLSFAPDDQAWMRHAKVSVPRFWDGHGVAPQAGDLLRIGGRQFVVQGRAWEQDGDGVVALRLFLSGSHAQSDTVFG
jgi:hypothetical protein